MLIFRLGQWLCRLLYCLYRQPIQRLCLTVTNSLHNHVAYLTKNRWLSVDPRFNVLSSPYLRPSIMQWIIIWTHWFGNAKPSNVLSRVTPILPNWDIMLNDPICPPYFCSWTNVHIRLLNIVICYFSKWNPRPSNIYNLVITYWLILSYIGWFPVFLLVSIAVTIINPFRGYCIDLHVGRINPGTFRAERTTWGSGLSGASMPLSRSISDSLSASQSSLFMFWIWQSLVQ